MSEQTNNTPLPSSTTEENTSRWTVSRITMLATGVLIALVLALFVFALVIALTASETWMPVMQIMRDTITIVAFMLVILIISSIAILIVQVAHLVNLLQTEIKPILDNARETAKATKATAQFVSKNALDPIIQLKSFFAGLGAFIRELLKIRSVIKPNKSAKEDKSDE